MARETTYNGMLGEWERLNQMMTANAAEVPHMDGSRQEFEKFLNLARDAAQRQAIHTAGKQEASQQLQTYLREGERLATILRLSLKQRFGIRSEKLIEFGMQPFRGRTRKPKTDPEQPAPEPAEPTQPTPQ